MRLETHDCQTHTADLFKLKGGKEGDTAQNKHHGREKAAEQLRKRDGCDKDGAVNEATKPISSDSTSGVRETRVRPIESSTGGVPSRWEDRS